jgi:hypothetical protein
MRKDPLQLISKTLHDRFDHISDQPLPRRWVELIHRLNEIEHRQTQMLVTSINGDNPKRRDR